MDETFSITVLIALFIIACFLIWFFKNRAKSKERILLIEKGIDIKDFISITEKKIIFQWLKIGIIITGIAIGSIFAALLMSRPTEFTMNRQLSGSFNTSVVLLFAGISMIIANFVGGHKK